MLNSFRVVFITSIDTDDSGDEVDCVYNQTGDESFYSFDWGSAPVDGIDIIYDSESLSNPNPTGYKYYGYDVRTIRDIYETYGKVGMPSSGIDDVDYGTVAKNTLANHACMGAFYTRGGSDDLLSPSVVFGGSNNDLGNTYCRPTQVNQDSGGIDGSDNNQNVQVIYDGENDVTSSIWPKYIYLGAIGAGAYGQGCLTRTHDSLDCQPTVFGAPGCGGGHICGTPDPTQAGGGLLDVIAQKGGVGSQASAFLKICSNPDRDTITIVCKLGKGGVQRFDMIDDIRLTPTIGCGIVPHHTSQSTSPHSESGSYTTFPTQEERITTISVYEGEDITDDDNLIIKVACPGGEPPRLQSDDTFGPKEISWGPAGEEDCLNVCDAFVDDCGDCTNCCCDNEEDGESEGYNGKDGRLVTNTVANNGSIGSVIIEGNAFTDNYEIIAPASDQDGNAGTAFNELLVNFGVDSHQGWHRTSVSGARDSDDQSIVVYTEEQINRFYEPGIGGNGRIKYWADDSEVLANKNSTTAGFTGAGVGGNGGVVYVGYGPEIFTKAITDQSEPSVIWQDITVAQEEIEIAILDSAISSIDFGVGLNRRNFIQKDNIVDTKDILDLTVGDDFTINGGLFSSAVPLEVGWLPLPVGTNIHYYDWTHALSIENNSRLVDEDSPARIEFVRTDLQVDSIHNPSLIREGASEIIDANWTTLIDPLGQGPNEIQTNHVGTRGDLLFDDNGYLIGFTIASSTTDIVEKVRGLKSKIEGSSLGSIDDLLVFYWVSPDRNRTNRIADYFDDGSRIRITFSEPDTTVTSDYNSYFLFTFGGQPAFLVPGDGSVFGTNPSGRSLCAFSGVRDELASGKIYYRPFASQIPGLKTRVQFHTEGIKLGANVGSTLTLTNVLADGSARDLFDNGGNIIVNDDHAGTLIVDSCNSSNGQSGIRTGISTGQIQLKNSSFEKTNGRNVELLGGGESGHEIYRCTFGLSNHKDALLVENSPNTQIYECLFKEIFNTNGRACALNKGSAWGSKVYNNLFINSTGFRESNTSSYEGSVDPTRYDYLAEYNNLYYVDNDKNIKNDSEQTWTVQDVSLNSIWKGIIEIEADDSWTFTIDEEDPLRKLWGLVTIVAVSQGGVGGTGIPELALLFESYERNSSVEFSDQVVAAYNFLDAHQNNPTKTFTINGVSFNGWNDEDAADQPICSVVKGSGNAGFLRIVSPELYHSIADTDPSVDDEFFGTFYRPGKTRKLVQEMKWTITSDGSGSSGAQASIESIINDKEIIDTAQTTNLSHVSSSRLKLWNGPYSATFGGFEQGNDWWFAFGGNQAGSYGNSTQDYWTYNNNNSRYTVYISYNGGLYEKVADPNDESTIISWQTRLLFSDVNFADGILQPDDEISIKVYEEVPSGVWNGTDTFDLGGSKLRMVNNSLYVDNTTFREPDNKYTNVWRFGTVDVVPNTIEWHLQNNFYSNGVQIASGTIPYDLFSDFNVSQYKDISGTFFSSEDLPYSVSYWGPNEASTLELNSITVDTDGDQIDEIYDPIISANDGGKIGNRWTKNGGSYLTVNGDIKTATDAVSFFSNLELNTPTVEPEDNPRWFNQASANDLSGNPVDNRFTGTVEAQAAEVDILKLAVVPDQTVTGELLFDVQVLAENINPDVAVGHDGLTPIVTVNDGPARPMVETSLEWPDPDNPGGFVSGFTSVSVWNNTVDLLENQTNTITVSSSDQDITFKVHHKESLNKATPSGDNVEIDIKTAVINALSSVNPGLDVIEIDADISDLGQILSDIEVGFFEQIRDRWLTIKPATNRTVTWVYDSSAPDRVPELDWIALDNITFGSDISDNGGGTWQLDAGYNAWLNNCKIKGKYKNNIGTNFSITAPAADLTTWSATDAQNRYFTKCHFHGTVTEGSPTTGAILTRDCAFSSHRTNFNQIGNVWLNCSAQDVQSIQDFDGGSLQQRGIEIFGEEATSDIIYKGFRIMGVSSVIAANFDPFIFDSQTTASDVIVDNINLGVNSDSTSTAIAQLSGTLENVRVSNCSFGENDFTLRYDEGFVPTNVYTDGIVCEVVQYKSSVQSTVGDIAFDRVYFENLDLDPNSSVVVTNEIQRVINENEPVGLPFGIDFNNIAIKVATEASFSTWQAPSRLENYQWTTDGQGGNFINTLNSEALSVPTLNTISTKSQNVDPQTYTVLLQDNLFEPEILIVNPGDTVKWEWVDGLHNVTSGTCSTPDGLFASDTSPVPGTIFTWDVPIDQEVGDIEYVCTIHCANVPPMEGVITIEESSVSSEEDGLYLKFDSLSDKDAFIANQENIGIQLTILNIETVGDPFEYIWPENVAISYSDTEARLLTSSLDNELTTSEWPPPQRSFFWGDTPIYNLTTYTPTDDVEERTVTQEIGETTFTWIFDAIPIIKGVFVDGSPWVVLPIGTKLESVSPAPTTETINGFTVHRNGVSINTHTGNEQKIVAEGGLVDTIENQWKTTDNRSTTTDSLDTHFDGTNFTIYRDQLSEVQLQDDDMILLTESFFDENDESGIKYTGVDTRTPIKQQAVLTILSADDAFNASNSFRPPIHWAAETGNRIDDGMFNTSLLVDMSKQLNHTQDSALVLTDRDGATVSTDNLIVGPILQYTDFTNTFESYSEYPAAIAQDNVGINIAGDVTEASNLVSILNHVLNEATNTNNSIQDRADYLNKIIQYGIDCYGAITTIGILGKSKDAGKAGMLKQWALFAMYALGQETKRSVDDILGNVFVGYDNADQAVIKSRLFQEDNTLKEVEDVNVGGDSYRINITDYYSSQDNLGILEDQSVKTTYSYDVPFGETNFGSLTLQNGFEIPNYSDLIGTILTVNSQDYYITMATDQFEQDFDYKMVLIESNNIDRTSTSTGELMTVTAFSNTIINYDWGITSFALEYFNSSNEANIQLTFDTDADVVRFNALRPAIKLGDNDLLYTSVGSPTGPTITIFNAFGIINGVADLLNTGFGSRSDQTLSVSYARPYRLWVDRRWGGTLTGDESFSIKPFRSEDQGSYVFCMPVPGGNGEGDVTEDVVSPSPYNSTHAQISGRAWLPTYAALYKLYTEAGDPYSTTDLGVTNSWLETYIFGEIAGTANRNWMIAFNNSQESFGKIEAPATFSNWV